MGTEANPEAAEAEEQQQNEKEKAEAAAFEAAFADDGSAPASAEPTKEPEPPEGEETGEQETKASPETAAKAPAGGGEPPAEEEPDAISELEKRLSTQFRNLAGQFGEIKSHYLAAQRAASETSPAGEQQQSQDAAKVRERLAGIKTQLQEFEEIAKDSPELVQLAKPVSGLMEAVEELSASAGGSSGVDLESAKGEFLTEAMQTMRSELDTLRESLRVEVKHPGWTETINTQEFDDWAYEGGPTKEEREHLNSLRQTSPEEAETTLNEHIRKYPQWWADRGSKMHSPHASDAIALLDGFSESKSATQKDVSAEQRRQSKQQRLEDAVAPTKGDGGKPAPKTEEQEFIEAFNAS